jgi:hypothetical protein
VTDIEQLVAVVHAQDGRRRLVRDVHDDQLAGVARGGEVRPVADHVDRVDVVADVERPDQRRGGRRRDVEDVQLGFRPAVGVGHEIGVAVGDEDVVGVAAAVGVEAGDEGRQRRRSRQNDHHRGCERDRAPA